MGRPRCPVMVLPVVLLMLMLILRSGREQAWFCPAMVTEGVSLRLL